MIETHNVTMDAESCRSNQERIPGDYVVLSVSDNGCAIDGETLKHIFEPFFSTKETGLGTGLGLSTVYGIIKQNSGAIEVESEIGKGTTFRIFLPRTREKADEIRKPAVKEHPGGIETILLVEDEDMVRALAKKILEQCGYKVLEASFGGEAFMICEKAAEEIHLLLTDVIMPHMSGQELFDRLKTIKPSLKVLYMSGYMEDVVAKHGVVKEDIHFIQKPFTIESLTGKVREVLED